VTLEKAEPAHSGSIAYQSIIPPSLAGRQKICAIKRVYETSERGCPGLARGAVRSHAWGPGVREWCRGDFLERDGANKPVQ
jgi:hypothetical protein